LRFLDTERRASLPLYALPELRPAKAAFWRALCVELERAGEPHVPQLLDFEQPIVPASIDRRTLFTQVCGYPLQKLFSSQATLLAAPVYQAPHCAGPSHCGVFVVHRQASYEKLSDLRGCNFVFGGPNSNSGMNLPRRAVAEIAGGSPFFKSAVEADSQGANLELVARGGADATCVDTVTLAFVERHRPQVAASLRILAPTPRSTSIPFVTSSATEPESVERLRHGLREVASASRWAEARAGLLLSDIVPVAPADYEHLLVYEHEASELGYPVLQ
jgi:ABC-type phosphate/phosphonate transport system substrate-binding protein